MNNKKKTLNKNEQKKKNSILFPKKTTKNIKNIKEKIKKIKRKMNQAYRK